MPAQTSVPIRLPGSFPSNVPHPSGYNASPLPPPTDYYVSRKELLEIVPDLGVMKSVPSAADDTVVLFDDKGQVKSSGVKLSDKADAETVETLVGEDKGKSARVIAKEEVNQLLGDNPDELYNTFEEVAGFIGEAKENYQAINNALSETAKTLTDVKATADSAAPLTTVQELQTIVETGYAKKSGVVKLYMAEDDPYGMNDLGYLGPTSPSELLAFSATVDVGDDEGNVIREGDSVYGTVGAEGFRVEREWVNPNNEYAKHGVYSQLDAGRLDISRTFFDDSYWVDAEESFSVGTAETPDGSLGIVLSFQGVDGGGGDFASAMTPRSIYVDSILGGLSNYGMSGYDGVSHIEFSQNGDIGYSYYNYEYGYEDYRYVNIEYIVQVADDYSMGYLYNLNSLEFSTNGSDEIRFYEYDWDSGIPNDRVIYLRDIYNSIYNSSGGSICFGDNYHSYDDTGTSAAFGLIDSNNDSIRAYFGTYGMEAHDTESLRSTMIAADQISTTSYTESGEWSASASIDCFGRVYASANIQTDGWVDAAEGITIGEAVLDQTSLQKLLALIVE